MGRAQKVSFVGLPFGKQAHVDDPNCTRTAARTFNANPLLLYVESTPPTERSWLDYKDTSDGRLDYDYYENGLLKDTVSLNTSRSHYCPKQRIESLPT